jgi:thiol-disulfide isomerase/thioredoxin
MRRVSSILLVLALVALSQVQAGSGSLPPNWWEGCKARPIASYGEYAELMQGEFKNKFVFVDFFMDYCPWCYYIMDDFNRLIEDMNQLYGKDKVAFIKVEGPKNRKLVELFGVKSYPTFAAVAPRTGGVPASIFHYTPRNYDTLRKWMIEVIGEMPQQAQQQH